MASNETVREVCEESKSMNWVGYWNAQGKTVEDLINRILSAHKREMAAKDAEIEKHERCYHALEVHCKQLEDAYMHAMTALNRLYSVEQNRMPNVPTLDEVEVLVDAQRVMLEGEAK